MSTQAIQDAVAAQLASTAKSLADQDKRIEFRSAADLAAIIRIDKQLCDPDSAQTSVTLSPGETFI